MRTKHNKQIKRNSLKLFVIVLLVASAFDASNSARAADETYKRADEMNQKQDLNAAIEESLSKVLNRFRKQLSMAIVRDSSN